MPVKRADAGAATLLLKRPDVGAFCIGGEVPIMYYSAAQKTIKVPRSRRAPRDPQASNVYANRIPGGVSFEQRPFLLRSMPS